MPSSARTLARTGLVGALTVAAVTLALPAAGAVTIDETLCDYTVGDAGGRGHAGANFDSAIGDDVVVRVGEGVSLDPFTGTAWLPDEFLDMLPSDVVSSAEGSGAMTLRVAETGDEYDVVLAFGPHPVTDIGGFGAGLQLTGVGGEVTPEAAGPHTLKAERFSLSFDTAEGDPAIELTCELIDGNSVVDAFTATTAASADEDPVRPAVVQTDFAEDEGSPVRPFLVGGLLTAAGAALVVRARTVLRRP